MDQWIIHPHQVIHYYQYQASRPGRGRDLGEGNGNTLLYLLQVTASTWPLHYIKYPGKNITAQKGNKLHLHN